jgi:AcrR family transcriptional regulator
MTSRRRRTPVVSSALESEDEMVYRPTAATLAARKQREESLIDAAVHIAGESGFQAATVSAVAGRAGVADGTVYTYFPAKADLLCAAFARAAGHELDIVRESVASAPGTSTERLAVLVDVFGRRALRGRQLAWALLFEPVDPSVEAERLVYRRAYADTVESILVRGVSAGELPEQDTRLVATALVGAIADALVGPLAMDRATAQPDGIRVDSIIHSITRFCVAGVAGDGIHPASERGRR